MLGGIEESATDPTEPDADSTAQAFDYDDVDDFEATALNALADLGDADDDKNVGDAIIQLQLAAFAAFNRAKGEGKVNLRARASLSDLTCPLNNAGNALKKSKPNRNASLAGNMDTGQVTQHASFRVPRDPVLDPKAIRPHRIRSRLHTLLIFLIHHPMMEFC